MSLSRAERQKLKDAHFQSFEITQLAKAVTGAGQPQKVDLTTEGWQAVLKSRAKWHLRFKANGGTDYGFRKVLKDFYARQAVVDQTPFIWLRIEYGRHISAQKTDYKAARQVRKTRKELKGFWWKA